MRIAASIEGIGISKLAEKMVRHYTGQCSKLSDAIRLSEVKTG